MISTSRLLTGIAQPTIGIATTLAILLGIEANRLLGSGLAKAKSPQKSRM